MDRNAVCSGLFAGYGGGNHTGLWGPSRLAKGGDMIDVDI
jgi:hypothetical protein